MNITWYEIVIGIVVVLAGAFIALQFKSFQEWLVFGVTKAESYFGSKTGQLKLRYVYNLALKSRFGWICSIISYAMFDNFVTKALEKMHKMIDGSKEIAEVLKGTKVLDCDEDLVK